MKKKEAKIAYIGVRLPKDIADRLAAFCKANGITASEAVRRLLEVNLLSPEEKETKIAAAIAEIEKEKARLEEEVRKAQQYFGLVSSTAGPWPGSGPVGSTGISPLAGSPPIVPPVAKPRKRGKA